MKTENRENYILLLSEENKFNDFLQNFEKSYSNLSVHHLIIQLSDNLNVAEEKILLLLKYAEEHQQNGMTFVVIANNVDVDVFPESFNIVPTLQEAEDVLEMENIQRDLGF